MHISFIIPDLKGGGAQKMMINLANEFAKRGEQVDLVLVNQSGIYKEDISDNVNIVNLNKKRVFQSILLLKKYTICWNVFDMVANDISVVASGCVYVGFVCCIAP